MLSAIGGFLFIFLCRVVDVSLGTLRMLFTVRGRKFIAGGIGVVEVSIFLFALSRVVSATSSWPKFLGYCLGFGTGTILGITLEEWLAPGNLIVHIVSKEFFAEIAKHLRDVGFGVTESLGRGKEGTVTVLESVIRRRDFPYFLNLVNEKDPEAFVTTGAAHFVYRGYWHKIKRK